MAAASLYVSHMFVARVLSSLVFRAVLLGNYRVHKEEAAEFACDDVSDDNA